MREMLPNYYVFIIGKYCCHILIFSIVSITNYYIITIVFIIITIFINISKIVMYGTLYSNKNEMDLKF